MMKKIIGGFICMTTILVACKNSKETRITNEKPPITVGTVINDSLAPPEITVIKNIRKIPAPKPKMVPLKYPYGVGQPSILKYSVGDGLPQNLILDIALDHAGNVWTCGLGFLNKFDGKHFTNYRSVNGAGSGFVNKILVDQKDNIWLGNFDGLYKFDGQSFQPTPLSHYPNLSIRSLCEDKQKAIWVASTNGVFRVEKDSLKKYGIKNDTSNFNCINIFTDKNGRVLVSSTKGMYEFQDSVFVPYLDMPNSNGHIPVIIGKDKKENLWFVQRSSDNIYLNLILYDGKNKKVYGVKDGFKLKLVNELIEDKNGIIWISTSNDGIVRFDGQQFIYFTMEDGLPSNSIFRMKEDNIGNIWACTTNGIARICYGFMNYLENVEPGEQYNNVLAIDSAGYRWVLNQQEDHKSLIQYHKDYALIYDLDNMEKSLTFHSIMFDNSGALWLHATLLNNFTEKSFKFDGHYFYEYGHEQGINLSGNSGFTDDKQGNVWVGGSGGLYKISGDTIAHFGAAEGFPTTVSGFFIDSKGNYWIGSILDSVYKYNGKTLTRYAEKDGYHGAFVNDIEEDPFGNIWFATDRSVSRFDGKRFYNYGQVDGFDNLVANITIDTANRLIWFSSINGLISLSFDNIDSTNLNLHRYYQRNGFDVVTSHIQYNKTYFDSLGMWGSSYNGPYRFDYNQVKKFKAPALQLTNIRINNQQVVWSKLLKDKNADSLILLNESVLKLGKPLDEELIRNQKASFQNIVIDSLQTGSLVPDYLKLPYKNNSITFEFASLSPSFGKYTMFRYKLEGYEDNWSPYSLKDEAFFGNMREGKYTFRLEAVSSTGAKSTLNYKFRVLPPWQRSWWAYVLYGLLFITGIYVFIKWRTKSLQKEKKILEEKVTERTAELKASLDHLNATQTQLVHSEKMASLGELTAGIAHEIQNPLNFVNNFSEVNREMIAELKEEIEKGNYDEVKIIASDIESNEEKINHHGKRADAIVKGMLQHSRTSSGQKEPTDINALCDEYLRLSYHGLRAKDKSFNANFETDFDTSIEKINIVPQDMGRVILNLINNAFYAVSERKKLSADSYQPLVSIKTRKLNDKIEIHVADNGGGIPDAIKEKIFQPFFTTKPTGQGTGLGLSLSYDIIKAHGGELKVESKEGEGTMFTIVLK